MRAGCSSASRSTSNLFRQAQPAASKKGRLNAFPFFILKDACKEDVRRIGDTVFAACRPRLKEKEVSDFPGVLLSRSRSEPNLYAASFPLTALVYGGLRSAVRPGQRDFPQIRCMKGDGPLSKIHIKEDLKLRGALYRIDGPVRRKPAVMQLDLRVGCSLRLRRAVWSRDHHRIRRRGIAGTAIRMRSRLQRLLLRSPRFRLLNIRQKIVGNLFLPVCPSALVAAETFREGTAEQSPRRRA